MNLKAFTRLISTAALLGAACAVSGQSMFDNFDSYTVGSIGGQGGWEGWEGNPVAGTVSTLQASSGTQSLQLVAGNDTVRPFSGVTSGLWTLSMQQYIPSASSGSSWIITMNGYPATVNENWSAQILADFSAGLIGVFDPSGQVGSTLSLIKDQWVDVRFEINLDANSMSAYYNNSLLGTGGWQSGGLNQLQALDLYPDETVGTTIQVGSVFYDNVQLSQVPEPSTIGLLLLGGLAILFRARKRA